MVTKFTLKKVKKCQFALSRCWFPQFQNKTGITGVFYYIF